jgi:4-hydroxythreonine-4-phosphate dehydrogenase
MVRGLVLQRVRRAVLVGDAEALAEAVARFAPGASWPIVDAPGDEPAEVRAIRWSVDAALAGRVRAVVTGPIHKARLAARGFGYPGHTEFLGALCGVDRPVMAFVGGALRVALVTVHVPLARVPGAVTSDAVLHTVRVAARALTEQIGIRAPRLVVCGLNPHAGDGGLLGHEDLDVIAPAVAAARALGVDAVGPISAEGAFLAARRGAADLVVAMYHDQGLAPLKAVDFGKSVNWTLGLPFVRTSVDHGTADDLVGTGRADPSSARAAVRLALQLTRHGQAGAPSIVAHQSASAPSVQQSDTSPSRS